MCLIPLHFCPCTCYSVCDGCTSFYRCFTIKQRLVLDKTLDSAPPPPSRPLPAMFRPQCAFWGCPARALSPWTLLQETVADELEEAYRGHVWDPSLRHVQKQKQGVTAARVELTSLFTKASPTLPLAQQKPFLPHCISANPGCIVTILHHVESGTCSLLLHAVLCL